jgi:leucyl-tRNA synthetase
VFTTRIDTIFGMTFCVLAPEHSTVELLPVSEQDRERIREYQTSAKMLSDTDRQAENREKTGCFTGAYAINPANGKHVPIWIADYVLATYGTGAIMAVPGHDQRDFDFATKFGIDILPVINGEGRAKGKVFESKDGTLINSDRYSGLSVADAQIKLGEWVEREGIGTRKIQYKLRDWLISRQRYWGCPIPVIHTKDGIEQLVPLKDLPVELPLVDSYEPAGDGTSPLAQIDDFVNVTDLDGTLGRRETDTMGGFACSSWYFLRFCDPDNSGAAWSPESVDYWMPVDCYVGGAEHAVMHLLYARFWTKVLHDCGLVKVNEPFSQLRNQGQVLGYTPYRQPRDGEVLGVGEDGILASFAEAKGNEKDFDWKWVRMSKSKGNVVTPDEAVEQYGADALRMYLLFVAPFNADVQWSNEGMQGIVRFLSRIFKFAFEIQPTFEKDWHKLIIHEEMDDLSRRIRRATHLAIRNCSDDIDKFGFNTYVSWLMKYSNELNECLEITRTGVTRATALALSEAVETMCLLLAPSAPHSADEIWQGLGHLGFTYHAGWPQFDASLIVENSIVIAVQVNGKLRDTLTLPANSSEEHLKEFAQASEKVKLFTQGKEIKKIIIVPGKLVSIVVAG